MTDLANQESLFEEPEGARPASEWDRHAAQRAIDDLFQFARQYNSSAAFHELMQFIARFRLYSPFNAMLAHIQMPGARFVAPPHRWERDYRRRIRPGARPIVLLQPMGPVMFAFDVSDTEALPDARPLPKDVDNPFGVRSGRVGNELDRSIENAKRDGIRVVERDAGSQSAGQIGIAKPGTTVRFLVKSHPELEYRDFPVRYELLLNTKHSPEVKYVTLAHELAHLYCGHLGTPNEKWWPDRHGLHKSVREFEAEATAFLVCSRLGIDNPSDEYLAGYVKAHSETPAISLDRILTAAGLIEQMGRERMKPRKEPQA
jgi:hypothetical protein